jgi:hypothetical protein
MTRGKDEPADPRDDVHALGVMWFQILTGDLGMMSVPPDWQEQALDRHLDGALVRLMARCLASKADKRPQTAGVLANELATLLKRMAPTPPAKDDRAPCSQADGAGNTCPQAPAKMGKAPPPLTAPALLTVHVEPIAVPQVPSSDLPPLSNEILDRESQLNGLRQAIDEIEKGQHPALRSTWNALKDCKTVKGRPLIDSLKRAIEKDPSRSLADLCTLVPDGPQPAVLALIHALKRLAELKIERNEVEQALHGRQQEDFLVIVDRWLVPSEGVEFPLAVWMALQPQLVARRYGFVKTARELLEKAEQRFAAVRAAQEATRVRQAQEEQAARIRQEREVQLVLGSIAVGLFVAGSLGVLLGAFGLLLPITILAFVVSLIIAYALPDGRDVAFLFWSWLVIAVFFALQKASCLPSWIPDVGFGHPVAFGLIGGVIGVVAGLIVGLVAVHNKRPPP